MITKEEYLKLIQKAYHQDDELDDGEELFWIPAKPEIKKKLQNLIKPNGDINATKMKKAEFSKLINKHNRITIGNFMVHIKSIVNPTGIDNVVEDAVEITEETKYNIVLYEVKKTTPSGMPCNIQVKLNIAKDNRFDDRQWAKGFTQLGGSVSDKTLIELLKWMQAITKLPAFL